MVEVLPVGSRRHLDTNAINFIRNYTKSRFFLNYAPFLGINRVTNNWNLSSFQGKYARTNLIR